MMTMSRALSAGQATNYYQKEFTSAKENYYSESGEVRGRWKEFAGRPLMVTYHPSYILRTQSNRSKRMIWEDLLQVMERAGLSITEKQRAYFLDK